MTQVKIMNSDANADGAVWYRCEISSSTCLLGELVSENHLHL